MVHLFLSCRVCSGLIERAGTSLGTQTHSIVRYPCTILRPLHEPDVQTSEVVKGDKYRALSPYEKLKEASPSWAKQENWRIAREMIREEIEKTDLGEFLNTL